MRANTLALNGGSIADSAGNPANLGHAQVNSNPLFVVDTAAPSVSAVAITSAVGAQNGVLNAGDTVNVTVTMSENMVVSGTPTIGLTIGANPVNASYVAGSSTANSLVFAYTILSGQGDNDGISIRANTLARNGGSIADPAGNSANLGHGSVPNNPLFVVDAVAPSVSAVAITSAVGAQNGVLNAGDTVNVTVTMSENTVVGGTPTDRANHWRHSGQRVLRLRQRDQ